MHFIFLLLVVLWPAWSFGTPPPDKPEFVVVIPSYNNGRNNNNMCLKNLESVFSQTYPFFSVIYIDDCSTDDTGALVDNFVLQHHLENRIKVIHNTENKGCMRNLYEVINTIEPYKIVIDVDGDDMLAHNHVLDKIAQIYSDKTIWMTLGSFRIFPRNQTLRVTPPSKAIIASGNFAYYTFVWYHLRTFYAKLFQLVKKEDLLYKGDFYPVTSDIAFLSRMLEMASHNHYKLVHEVLYLYYQSPICDYTIRRALQAECWKDIQSKRPYKPLETLFECQN